MKAVKKAQQRRQRGGPNRQAASSTPEAGLLNGYDLGNQLALDRGLVEYKLDEIVPLDPDSKRSAVRLHPRAQRVWTPQRLADRANPAITPEQLQAASRLYDEYLIGIQGARTGRGTVGYTAPWNRCPFQERRAMCRESFLRATNAVGATFGGILVWIVLQETSSPDVAPTVEKWAEHKTPGWSIERSVGFLAGALEALAVHYGMSRTGRMLANQARREYG